MKTLEIEQMEKIEGGDIINVIGCVGTAWGAIGFGITLVALAAGGPVGWFAIATLIVSPTIIGVGVATCIS